MAGDACDMDLMFSPAGLSARSEPGRVPELPPQKAGGGGKKPTKITRGDNETAEMAVVR